MSKLIVIEGIDGSGKGTQSKLLHSRLVKENYDLHKLSFPQYSDSCSFFVRAYLNGDYGMSAEDVSPKQASLCYAMDRFHTFKAYDEIKKAVASEDAILLADRYTTSNILYQSTKAKSQDEIYQLIDWICELEYGVLQIPEPDIVIMPYVEIEKNIEMMRRRDIAANANANNMQRDIHEQNLEYLRQVHAASEIIAQRMGFEIINCMDENGKLRTPENIHEEIYQKVDSKVLQYVKKKQ